MEVEPSDSYKKYVNGRYITSCASHECRDYDGKVTPEEVAAAALYLKNTLGKEGIQELVSSLSKDRGNSS